MQIANKEIIFKLCILAVQILFNDQRSIIGKLQAAVCLYDHFGLPRQHVATHHFDHERDTTL